ncbi:MAG: hypothetical protein WAP03_22800 [Methylorubrum rhodinum]
MVTPTATLTATETTRAFDDGRIADHPAKRLTDLLPWNWTSAQPAMQAA